MGISESDHYVWFDRLPEDLRARISGLNRKSPWMHRIIGCIEVTPGVPEAELLWRAICGLIEQIEGDHGAAISEVLQRATPADCKIVPFRPVAAQSMRKS